MLQVRIKREDVTRAEERAFGTYVHGVLELFLDKGISLEDAIEEYSLGIPYWLRDGYKESLIEFFLCIKRSKAFHQFLSLLKGAVVYVEKEMLGPKGQRFRLDVLAKKDGEVHVIDYKLGKESEEHISQLMIYYNILSSRLSERVYGWLFYLRPEGSELKRVI